MRTLTKRDKIYNCIRDANRMNGYRGVTRTMVAKLLHMPTSTVTYHVKKMVLYGFLHEEPEQGRGNVPIIYKYMTSGQWRML